MAEPRNAARLIQENCPYPMTENAGQQWCAGAVGAVYLGPPNKDLHSAMAEGFEWGVKIKGELPAEVEAEQNGSR